MKTKLLYLLLAVFFSFTSNAQVSMIGPGANGDANWATDTDMVDAGGGMWTLTAYTMPGGDFKFRLNHDWGTNWGAASFPTGTGVANGANIPAIANTYDITFNQNTGEYSFSGGVPLSVVKLIGTSVTEAGGLLLSPQSPTLFKATNVTLLDGTGQFEIDGQAFGEDGLDGTIVFPEGDLLTNTNNIPVIGGVYTSITLDLNSGHYSFVAAPVYPSIAIVGSGAGGWPNDPQVDANVLTTADGETYTGTFTLTADTGNNEIKFRSNNNWSDPNWGGGSFPTGPTDGTQNITVTVAGTYDVVFTRSTGAYTFSFPLISLTGAAFGGWGDGFDFDMTTTDGANFTVGSVTAVATDGAKFRTNHVWNTPNYGSTSFPSGIALSTTADNIPVVAGTYSVTFNRVTGAFNFDVPFATTTFNSTNFKVYPNPTTNVWNFTSAKQVIETIQIVDVLGKTVMTVSPKDMNTTVDASNLTRGLYFAKISTANATETAKLMKN